MFGKGVVFFCVEGVLKNLVELIGIFFLVIFMVKGILFDVYFLFVLVVWFFVIGEVDVVLVVGVRLNWLFYFGEVL